MLSHHSDDDLPLLRNLHTGEEVQPIAVEDGYVVLPSRYPMAEDQRWPLSSITLDWEAA